MDLFLTNMQLFTEDIKDRLESCGLLLDYCDVFISSAGTHSPSTGEQVMVCG